MRPIAAIAQGMALSSAPNDSEDGRAFLQRRLALFGKSVFLLFLAIGVVAATVTKVVLPDEWPRDKPVPVHLALIYGVGLLWLFCRRGNRSLRVLTALDAASVVIVGVGLALAVKIAPRHVLSEVSSTFALTHLLLARAIIVPSDWRRTLWISALAAAGLVAGLLVLRSQRAGVEMMSILPAILTIWSVVAIAVASWASHVIYRLRRRVVEARRLGQYTLEEKIGEGGMGIVFRARHAMLRRPTVVKLLPLDRAGQANLARFEREVQLTSQLSSPNTVAVYDFGRTPDGIFYYAMEHLDGVDLDALVEAEGPQPPGRVIHLLSQVCRALSEAHDAGLVHRDIKPGNVMLGRQGGLRDVVKILDFGLVKDVAARDDVKLTRADAFLGTPLYLSPEAINQPETVDARSDLYSVGGVGYFLLTGQPVFTGRTVAELCAKHLYEPPVPPSVLAPGIPRDLQTILLACLEKSPDQRPRDAMALRDRLLACADAGRWSDQDARARWQKHAPSTPRPKTDDPTSASAPTLPDQRVDRQA
jgi:eukaryotic-like serine/threonine-protein kinase